jgi:chorismate mutase
MGMSEHQDDAASEREEIAARVASFKATQERFQREREEYCVATLENARQSENARHTFDEQPPIWS